MLAIILFFWLGLPAVLQGLGLHPPFDGPRYTLPGKRALIVTTSHGTLNKPGQTDGKATGVFASEMTAPYYAFLDAGMQVDVASIRGGEIPVEPDSLRWFLASPAGKRYLKDAEFQAKTRLSPAVAQVDFARYDIVFLAGGWGAAYHLGTSAELAHGLSSAWAAAKVVAGGRLVTGQNQNAGAATAQLMLRIAGGQPIP